MCGVMSTVGAGSEPLLVIIEGDYTICSYPVLVVQKK